MDLCIIIIIHRNQDISNPVYTGSTRAPIALKRGLQAEVQGYSLVMASLPAHVPVGAYDELTPLEAKPSLQDTSTHIEDDVYVDMK